MGIIQLPDHLRQVIARQIAEGRAESEDAYLEEAVRRYAEELEAEDEILIAAETGIRDIETGHYATISSSEDAAVLHERAMLRLRDRLVPDDE
jgi:Arc/MetJ-type ribon-helix-helix transcriptional regulator